MFSRLYKNIDWILVGAIVPVLLAGLVTMASFSGQGNYPFKQLIWIIVAFLVFFALAATDVQVFKKASTLIWMYGAGVGLLAVIFLIGHISKGAARWISLGGFSLQPADPMKIILVLVLAKYLSRRHIEIANIKHIFITAAYFLVPFILVFLQPDLGSAMILAIIWLGLMLASGISKKHLAILFGIAIIVFGGLWMFILHPYQKARIANFINPTANIQTTGYHVYQSMIAVGSGEVLGKGVGYGTQSRLNFLPEYRTDFVFAAFAEEWGLIGCFILICCFVVVIWRILRTGMYGSSNFEILYSIWNFNILYESYFGEHWHEYWHYAGNRDCAPVYELRRITLNNGICGTRHFDEHAWI